MMTIRDFIFSGKLIDVQAGEILLKDFPSLKVLEATDAFESLRGGFFCVNDLNSVSMILKARQP